MCCLCLAAVEGPCPFPSKPLLLLVQPYRMHLVHAVDPAHPNQTQALTPPLPLNKGRVLLFVQPTACTVLARPSVCTFFRAVDPAHPKQTLPHHQPCPPYYKKAFKACNSNPTVRTFFVRRTLLLSARFRAMPLRRNPVDSMPQGGCTGVAGAGGGRLVLENVYLQHQPYVFFRPIYSGDIPPGQGETCATRCRCVHVEYYTSQCLFLYHYNQPGSHRGGTTWKV